MLTSNSAILSGSKLTVGAGVPSVFGSAVAAAVTRVGSAAAVPEPGTLALLIAGLVVGFGLRLKRKAI